LNGSCPSPAAVGEVGDDFYIPAHLRVYKYKINEPHSLSSAFDLRNVRLLTSRNFGESSCDTSKAYAKLRKRKSAPMRPDARTRALPHLLGYLAIR